jgi:hypothetical protein
MGSKIALIKKHDQICEDAKRYSLVFQHKLGCKKTSKHSESLGQMGTIVFIIFIALGITAGVLLGMWLTGYWG